MRMMITTHILIFSLQSLTGNKRDPKISKSNKHCNDGKFQEFPERFRELSDQTSDDRSYFNSLQLLETVTQKDYSWW